MKRTKISFICDNCSEESPDSFIPCGWYKVGSTYMLKDVNCSEQEEIHACKACGRDLICWLAKLGVPFDTLPPKESDLPSELGWGRITVGMEQVNYSVKERAREQIQ